ncbi:MAG: methyltransferase domain-containing protein [Deltaproteobacteria bacterium]|nr:methyltransferase domain-containing protein [Deltaproteobacteria bacterium]
MVAEAETLAAAERAAEARDEAPAPGSWDPQAEVRCGHVAECGACPLMPQRYARQRALKMERVAQALERYGLRPADALAEVEPAEPIAGYRRRAKLVVARTGDGRVAVGLYRRADNQSVVDIPDCRVLSPTLRELVASIRLLAQEPPAELGSLLRPAEDGTGVFLGLDARELDPPDEEGQARVMLTLALDAARAEPLEALRSAARELRRRLPVVVGLAVSLKQRTRQQGSPELVALSGAAECRDGLGGGYQLVSFTSFLHVHRRQAERLHGLLARLVSGAVAAVPARVLDLYGGTGAIALSLAQQGHAVTLVESYPPAAELAARAAQAQRLPIEVVTGDVASVTRALGAAGSKFDVVVANPPRRGLSPAAREALTATVPKTAVYVACDLDNLSRDLDHLARLGYRLRDAFPLDMLPFTEEVEVVAVLERAPVPAPRLLYLDDEVVALDKPPHEPVLAQPEYPGSLVERGAGHDRGGAWLPVLEVGSGTSGVCLFVRREELVERWSAALAATGRLVYLAAARGITPAKGAINRELRSERGMTMARTRYRRLAIGGGHSVLRVVPERRHVHQIRRHLAAIGHPVLGDARYGHAPTNRYFEEKHGLDRSFLHLVRVEVDHPRGGDRLIIESPLPPDLRAALVRASDESVLRFLENKGALGDRRRRRDEEGTPESAEPSALSILESAPDSIAISHRPPESLRGLLGPDLDEAPRTIRGELLTPDDDE